MVTTPARAAITAMALSLGLAACASGGIPGTLDPEVATRAIAETAPDRTLRVIFDWELLDGGARFTGDGVARIQPPYRVRLDLFGPRGDGYLSAVAVGMELRLPAGAAEAPLPPPTLMWAVLGVVRPPDDARLAGTRTSVERTEIWYDLADATLRFVLQDGRLRSAVLRGDGRHMAVELSGRAASGDLPGTAYFRDPSGGTELRITVDQTDEVDAYPPEIWIPDV